MARCCSFNTPVLAIVEILDVPLALTFCFLALGKKWQLSDFSEIINTIKQIAKISLTPF
jgi:hypothetical protein